MISKKHILAGKNIRTGEKVYIPPDSRTTHMHIIGSTGEGKSKFMEHMIREDIIRGNGLCLIDPHGSLYKDVVAWCASRGMLSRKGNSKKILLLDPKLDEWTFAFNPMATRDSSVSFFTGAMIKAIAMVWGGEDTNKTPRLKRCLKLILRALIEQDLTLLEAVHLIDSDNPAKRKLLTAGIKEQVVIQEWQRVNDLKAKPFIDEFESTINRLMDFLDSPHIKNILGQREQTIDFRRVMDEGGIVLVDLSIGKEKKIPKDSLRLLGTLIVNDLLLNALSRDRNFGKRHPFYLYIDECSDFVNGDIGDMLDQTRKFGLHAILANQTLAQLKKAGDSVYESVMNNAKTKVVFGGLTYENAKILAPDIFDGEQINLQEPKEIMNKPVVVGHKKEWFKSVAHSHSVTSGTSWSSTETRGESESHGTNRNSQSSTSHTDTYSFALSRDMQGGNIQRTINYGDANASSSSSSSGESHSVGTQVSVSYSEGGMEAVSDTEMEGYSERLVPILEWLPGQLYSKDEQLYRSAQFLRTQANQHAVIKLPKDEARFIKTPFVRQTKALKKARERFLQKNIEINHCIRPALEVEQELEERSLLIEEQAKRYDNPAEPQSFINKEPPQWQREKVKVKSKKKQGREEEQDIRQKDFHKANTQTEEPKPDKKDDLDSVMDDLWGDI